MPDIRSLLGIQTSCPTCKNGALKTDADRARGYCDGCHMMRGGYDRREAEARVAKLFPFMTAVAAKVSGPGFRSEADAYGEGVMDDD